LILTGYIFVAGTTDTAIQTEQEQPEELLHLLSAISSSEWQILFCSAALKQQFLTAGQSSHDYQLGKVQRWLSNPYFQIAGSCNGQSREVSLSHFLPHRLFRYG